MVTGRALRLVISIGVAIGLSAAVLIAPVSAASPAGVPRAKISAPKVSATSTNAGVVFTWTRGTSSNDSLTWDVDIRSSKSSKRTVSTPRLEVNSPPGTSVSVRVRTRVGSEAGPWSTVVGESVPVPAPASVTASDVGPHSAKITWTSVRDADSYDVLVDGSRRVSVKSPSTSTVITSLTPSTRYVVSIIARANGSRSNASKATEFTTVPGPPADPAQVTVSAITPTSATVSWSPVPGVDSYIVFLDGERYVSEVAPTNVTELRNLVPGDQYAVRVVSVRGGVSSSPGATAAFAAALTAPQGLLMTNVTQTAATFTWGTVPGAVAYEVSLNGAITVQSTTANSAFIGGLIPGQSYTPGVRTIFAGSRYSERSVTSFTTLPDPAYVPVNNVLPSIGAINALAPFPGLTLKSQPGTWTSATVVSFAYQWQKSTSGTFLNIANATSPDYVVRPEDIGGVLRVQVTATNGNGSTLRSSAQTDPVAIVAPQETPSATGYGVVGQTLTYQDVAWSTSPPPALTLMWQKSNDGSSWSDDTLGLNYLITQSSYDKYIRVKVTAVSPLGRTTYYSSTRGPIAASVNIVSPIVQGQATQGRTLTSGSGSWVPSTTSLTYAWQRSTDNGATWTVISGATSSTYALTVVDVGTYVRSAVSGSVAAVTGSSPVTAWSSPVGPVSAMPNLESVSPPVITGIPRVGTSLSSSAGTWTGAAGATYTYDWQSSSNALSWISIAGATASTYTPVVGDAGKYLRVRVTATASSVSGAATSLPSTQVNAPALTVLPAISGDPRVAATLTGSVGTWAGDVNAPTSYTYQWQYSTDGVVWDDTAATTTSIVPAGSLGATRLRFAVSATNASGTTTVYSSATVPLTPPLPSAIPVISGTAQVGQTLTSSAGEWSGATVSVVYQWQSSSDGGTTWRNVEGSSSSSFVIPVGLQASQLRCRVSVVLSSGTSSAYSEATGAVRP